MKKQLILALALSVSVLSFGQKKELKEVEKALKSGDFATAKTLIKKAEGLMASMDDKTKAKYYFLNAKALYAKGKASNEDIALALENLGKIGNSSYKVETEALKTGMVKNFIDKGNDDYEKGNYSSASKYFENAYRVSPKDTSYLYYAASTAVNSKEYERSLNIYEELKSLNYTGISTQYYATNKDTNKEELFDKQTRDLYVKAGSHIKPGIRNTKSKKAEIVKNIALIYLTLDKKDKALEAFKDARAQNPDDINMILNEANIHYEMGNIDEFKKLLVVATEKDPNNPELQYNLGVISSQSKDYESAKKYYNKAIELNPNYIDAYINLASMLLKDEGPIVDEMNGLGTSSADNKRYDELRVKRQNIYKASIPYLTKALEIDPNSINAAKTLMNIYSILGETDKYKSLKAKVEALEAGN